MQTFIALLLMGIATWRVSYMFVFETGPGDVFQRIRDAVGVIDGEDGVREIEYGLPWWRHFLAGVFSCIYCMSVWVGAFFAIFYAPNIIGWLLYLLFCSFAAIFINLLHERLHDG